MAPQLVHFMEIWTGSGNGVFYVAFALASIMAITTLLLPKGAPPPKAALQGAKIADVTAPPVGPDTETSLTSASKAGGVADEGLPAPCPFTPPIIWDEAGDEEDCGGGAAGTGGASRLTWRRGGKWRMAFRTALLALIFSNVSIELGESGLRNLKRILR